jgi:hypothetical protein
VKTHRRGGQTNLVKPVGKRKEKMKNGMKEAMKGGTYGSRARIRDDATALFRFLAIFPKLIRFVRKGRRFLGLVGLVGTILGNGIRERVETGVCRRKVLWPLTAKSVQSTLEHEVSEEDARAAVPQQTGLSRGARGTSLPAS